MEARNLRFKRTNENLTGLSVEQNFVARLYTVKHAVHAAHKRNTNGLANNSSVRRGCAFFEDEAFQFIAVIIEQFRRPNIARKDNSVIGNIFIPHRDIITHQGAN